MGLVVVVLEVLYNSNVAIAMLGHKKKYIHGYVERGHYHDYVSIGSHVSLSISY